MTLITLSFLLRSIQNEQFNRTDSTFIAYKLKITFISKLAVQRSLSVVQALCHTGNTPKKKKLI